MNKVIQLGGSAAFIPTFENAAYGIEWTKDDMVLLLNLILDLVLISFLIKLELIKKADYNSKRGSDGQDTDKAVRVLLFGGGAHYGSSAGSGFFYSNWVRSGSLANVGFFTTVKLD